MNSLFSVVPKLFFKNVASNQALTPEMSPSLLFTASASLFSALGFSIRGRDPFYRLDLSLSKQMANIFAAK